MLKGEVILKMILLPAKRNELCAQNIAFRSRPKDDICH